jgi:hypothetical protein
MSTLRIGDRVNLTTGIFPRPAVVVGARGSDRWRIRFVGSRKVTICSAGELVPAPETAAHDQPEPKGQSHGQQFQQHKKANSNS